MEELETWKTELMKEIELSNYSLSERVIKYSTSKRYQENILLRLTFEFALDCIRFTKKVKNEGHSVLAHQLFKSSTSVGANSKEAQNAESKADFIHKLKIALKEADESEYWLFLCENIEDCSSPDHLIGKLSVIQKILTKIISTSKTRK